MSISFKGINEQVITFRTEQALENGTLVALSGNGTVSACKSGDKIAGVVVSCRDALAAVQVSGYVNVPYTGTAPELGYTAISASGDQAIAADTDGREVLVVETDSTALTAGILL